MPHGVASGGRLRLERALPGEAGPGYLCSCSAVCRQAWRPGCALLQTETVPALPPEVAVWWERWPRDQAGSMCGGQVRVCWALCRWATQLGEARPRSCLPPAPDLPTLTTGVAVVTITVCWQEVVSRETWARGPDGAGPVGEEGGRYSGAFVPGHTALGVLTTGFMECLMRDLYYNWGN